MDPYMLSTIRAQRLDQPKQNPQSRSLYSRAFNGPLAHTLLAQPLFSIQRAVLGLQPLNSHAYANAAQETLPCVRTWALIITRACVCFEIPGEVIRKFVCPIKDADYFIPPFSFSCIRHYFTFNSTLTSVSKINAASLQSLLMPLISKIKLQTTYNLVYETVNYSPPTRLSLARTNTYIKQHTYNPGRVHSVKIL